MSVSNVYDRFALGSCGPASKNADGFSLLEVLLSIGLGTLLMITIIHVWITFQRTLYLQMTLADLQQRGRLISQVLTAAIHRAGDASCIANQWTNQAQAIGGSVLQLGECIRYHNQWQFKQMQYFVADSGRKNNVGKPISSLFVKIEGSEREELAENVTAMQVLYGIAKPHTHAIAAYLPADKISDWQRVQSVDITWVLAPLNKAWHLYVMLRERS